MADYDDETARHATANLAALNRAKALAKEWETHVTVLDALAASKEDPADRAEAAQAAQAYQDCARQLREAIRTEGGSPS